MEKRKILFVIPSMTAGGAERVFLQLLNHLNRDRYEPFLALGARRDEFLVKLDKDIKIFEIKAERARSAIPKLVKIVRNLRPQTVFSTLGMNFAIALSKPLMPRGTRVVLREGSSLLYLENAVKWAMMILSRPLTRNTEARRIRIISQCKSIVLAYFPMLLSEKNI